MRRILLLIVVAALFTDGFMKTASAEDVLVLMSIKTTGYQEMLKSAQNACVGSSAKIVVLSESTDINISQVLRTTRPKVVLAVGDRAYKLAMASAQNTPVIGALVLDQKQNTLSYLAPPEMFLAAMKKLGRKQIGIVYGKKMSSYVHRAAELARRYGITLVRRDADSPAGAIDQFSAIKGHVDGFWLLPDTAVLTAGTVETTLKLAQDRNIPVFAFSSAYLKSGAAVVIEPDRELLGREVGKGVCSVVRDVADAPQIQKDVYREIGNDLIFDRLRLHKKNFFN